MSLHPSTLLPPVYIIEAQRNEYPDLLRLWERSVRHTHLFLQEEDVVYFKYIIRDELLANLKVYCIKRSGIVLGFLAFHQHYLDMLFIDPAYLRQRLGSLLLEFARDKGVSEVEVNEQNERAVRFYLASGLKVVARQPADGFGKPYPLLLMRWTASNTISKDNLHHQP